MRFLLLLTLASLSFGASLRGSRDSQKLQNKEADREKLSRLHDGELKKFETSGLLVKIPESAGVFVDSRLDPKQRYCRPWTAKFLRDYGRQYGDTFQDRFKITSAVRTVEEQATLRNRRYNPNAAPAQGRLMSSHPTGSTIDISKNGMSAAELAWFREKLISLEEKGLIEATEERREPCFHIMVFRAYANQTSRTTTSRKKR
jgi:hypothetical protein